LSGSNAATKGLKWRYWSAQVALWRSSNAILGSFTRHYEHVKVA